MRTVDQLPDERRWVLIARNPKAGARDSSAPVAALRTQLEQRGYSTGEFTDLDELKSEAEQSYHQGQLRCVVAAGGDGTVALLANTLPAGLPIAVLPLGTENLLAKYLGISAHAQDVADLICQGTSVRLDAGQANGRLFLVMLSCGFDADVVRRVHTQRTGHIHHLSYAKPILDSIRSYRYPELRVCNQEQAIEVSDASESRTARKCLRARWAFVFNLPRYAAGLSFMPQAVGTDGLLDVCTFRKGSLWHGLRYLVGILSGWHQTWPDYQAVRTPRLRIECDEAVPFQCDGDPGGVLPVDIEVLPERLTLIVSRLWAEQHDFQMPTATLSQRSSA